MVTIGVVEAAVDCLDVALPDALVTAVCTLLANFACNSKGLDAAGLPQCESHQRVFPTFRRGT